MLSTYLVLLISTSPVILGYGVVYNRANSDNFVENLVNSWDNDSPSEGIGALTKSNNDEDNPDAHLNTVWRR